ncbi:MAG: response regulator [Steroidobacteraceae bacterium]
MFGMLLEEMGHYVDLAYGGEDAIAVAQRCRPEVIFLDIAMPGVDGYEVARRLRRERQFKDVLIIAVTGLGHHDAREQTRNAGFDEHLVKPADPCFLKSFLSGLR